MAQIDHSGKSETTSRVLKTLGIFGGVQVATILCSVVRTKLAALWIGPAGVGLLALYNSTIELLNQTSQLSMNQSAVRDLSATRDDAEAGPRIVGAFRTVLKAMGLIGFAVVLLASPLISLWVFGDTSHTIAFCLLAIIPMLSSIINTEATIMRGYDRLRPLAKTSLYSSVALVVTAVPLFYFFRLRAVVPVLILAYAFNALFAIRFRQRDIVAAKETLAEAWKLSRPMLSLGTFFTLSTFVTLLASNIFVVYLNRSDGGDSVGIYQAGYTLLNTYVGLLLTAMSTEFYPRLSAMKSAMRMEVAMNHEIKIILWILLPLLIVFICCSELCISILYSSKFSHAIPFIIFGAPGVVLRAVATCICFSILAKGSGKIYIFTETFSALMYLALYIPLYRHFGYTGLGIAYTLWYGAYLSAVYLIYRRRFGLKLRRGIPGLIFGATATAIAAVAGYHTIGPVWTLILLLPATAVGTLRNLKYKSYKK